MAVASCGLLPRATRPGPRLRTACGSLLSARLGLDFRITHAALGHGGPGGGRRGGAARALGAIRDLLRDFWSLSSVPRMATGKRERAALAGGMASVKTWDGVYLQTAQDARITPSRGRLVSTEGKTSKLQVEDAGSLVNPLASQ